jgi:hypothetical protein
MSWSIIQRIKAKREHELKSVYLKQFIFLAERGKNSGDIIKELYYYFMGDRYFRKVLLKAMRMPPSRALDYIYSYIGCDPMKIIHGFIVKREGQGRDVSLQKIPYNIIQYFYELIEQWEEDYQQKNACMRKRRVKAFLEVILYLCMNFILYLRLGTDICLWIFAIVNTLGVILCIVLDNESYIVDLKEPEGTPARRKWMIKKTQAPAKGIQSLYQLVSGMGLIINIFIVVSGWLGPVA